VYISGFSRFASARTILGRQELYLEVTQQPSSYLKPFRKTNFSLYDVSNPGLIACRNHKTEELNPSILLFNFIDEQL
jgi:hypothetical protein